MITFETDLQVIVLYMFLLLVLFVNIKIEDMVVHEKSKVCNYVLPIYVDTLFERAVFCFLNALKLHIRCASSPRFTVFDYAN